MHKNWCGKLCSDCTTSCALDESMPCSPDCAFLGANGEHDHLECQRCDALRLYRVPICYDGFLNVRATSEEDARNLVCSMMVDKMYSKSDGTWEVGAAEEEAYE